MNILWRIHITIYDAWKWENQYKKYNRIYHPYIIKKNLKLYKNNKAQNIILHAYNDYCITRITWRGVIFTCYEMSFLTIE